ncbi:MAG: response regulator [Verrucomicrobiota bacterium]|nr:response regulator [Verrucomicrobiota bacterium]
MTSAIHSTHKGSLLVIDDDPGIIESLALHWKHKEIPYNIIFSETVEDALRVLATQQVDVVLTDQQLPDATGLFLMTEINRRHPLIKVILMTARPSEETRLKALALGAVEFIAKPFDLNTLDSLLLNIRSIKHVGFSGIIYQLSLADMVQLKCSTLARVKIILKNGPHEGILYFDKGSFIHSKLGGLEGEEAFYQMFSWQRGQFEEHPYLDNPVKNIKRNWEGLLLEAAQKKDEILISSDQDFDSLPPQDTTPEPLQGDDAWNETKNPPDENAVINLSTFPDVKGSLISSRSGTLLTASLDENPNQAGALASFLVQQGECLARILREETTQEVFIETVLEKRFIFPRGQNLVAIHLAPETASWPMRETFKQSIKSSDS